MRNNHNLGGFLFLCLLGFLFMMLSISGCSCEAKLGRIKNKCPQLLVKDTIKYRDTIYSPLVQKDTIFKFFSRDTVIVREGQLTMKYFYNSSDSTVYLSGKCDTVKIPFEVKIPYEKIVYQENVWSFLKSYWWLPLLIILTFFVYLKLKK